MIDVFKNKFYFFKTKILLKNYQDCEGLDIPSLPHFKIAKAN